MKKIVLVTGCSRGLGRLLAVNLSTQGFIVYAGVREAEAKIALDEEWRKGKLDIRAVKLEVTSDEDCQNAVKKIISEEGRLDVLINNASVSLAGRGEEASVRDYLNVLNVNSVGAFRLIKEVLPYMKNQKSGRIVNITSLNGRVALPNFSLYSSSKFALEALGLALRQELRKYGVYVTNIAPGAIANPKEESKKLPHKTLRERFWLANILMPMVTREEITKCVKSVILSSDPPAQIILGRDCQIATFLQRFLPQFLWDKLLSSIWK